MRLFIGINLDKECLSELKRIQNDLRRQGIAGHFVPEENLHLTLAFIGEYTDPEEVLEVMEMVPFEPIPLRLDGVGRFGDLLWAGAEKTDPLQAVVKRLRHGLSDAGIPFDRKRFSPHITLVRKARWQHDDPFEAIKPPAASMKVKEITLFRSDRAKQGMIYTDIGGVQ